MAPRGVLRLVGPARIRKREKLGTGMSPRMRLVVRRTKPSEKRTGQVMRVQHCRYRGPTQGASLHNSLADLTGPTTTPSISAQRMRRIFFSTAQYVQIVPSHSILHSTAQVICNVDVGLMCGRRSFIMCFVNQYMPWRLLCGL